MKKIVYSLIVFVCFCNLLHGQFINYEWANSFGGNGKDGAGDVIIDGPYKSTRWVQFNNEKIT